MRRRSIQTHLGPEIWSAEPVPESPLFVYDPAGEHTDLTKKNLLIHGYWSDVLKHLKRAFVAKDLITDGTFFRFTVLTDERLRTVYVGAESYVARARTKRDDMQTFNSLSDVVGAEFDLVIIRLGHLGYKNIAMPGILKESLMLREVALKPTWLIDSPQSPFAPGHFAYSEDVKDYINTNFEVITISRYDEGREEAVAPQGYWGQASATSAVEDVTPGEEATPEGYGENAPAQRRPPPLAFEADMDISMFDREKPKKKKPTWQKSKRGRDE